MADQIALGTPPGRLTVYLRARGDFWAGLKAINADGSDRDWPDGTVFTLAFYEREGDTEPAVSWPATVTGGRAEWYVPRVQVAADVITPNRSAAALIYTSPDGKVLDLEEGEARWS